MSPCDYCGEEFSSWHYKNNHERSEHPEQFNFDCPSCDKSLKSKRGLRTHHKQSHDESLVQTYEISCGECGEMVERDEYDIEESGRVFCSTECYHEFGSEFYVGENHHNWVTDEESVKEVYDCENCGETVLRYPRQVNEFVFCSSDCNQIWIEREYSGKNHPDWQGGPETVQCDICQENYVERYGHELENTEVVVCSRDCLYEWTSEGREMPNGEDHWCWKDETSRWYYGSNWRTARRRVKERDEVCQVCLHDGSDRNLDVHHIKKLRKFDDPKESNTPDNLILLCRRCHMKVEHGNWMCPHPRTIKESW
jgi:hypothetical protein